MIADRFAICAGNSIDAAERGNSIASTNPSFASFGDHLQNIPQE